MRMRFVAALAAALLAALYLVRHGLPLGEEPERAQTIGAQTQQPALSLAEARAAWRAGLRVQPDRRCLQAAALLAELKGGPAGVEAVASYDEATSRWTISVGQPIGSLPELPDIEDCEALLSGAPGSAAPAVDVTPLAPQAFAGPDALLKNLQTLDDGTEAGSWPTGRIDATATALTFLYLQGVDLLDIDPGLPALVLAFDALATERTGTVNAARRALVAHLFGYGATARVYAARLPDGDAIRSFVLREDDALRRSAAKAYVDDLRNYLVLRRLAERGDYAGWSAWLRRYTMRNSPAWTVWQTATMLDAFKLEQYADTVPQMVALQVRVLAGRETMKAALAGIGIEAPSPTVFAVLDALVAKSSSQVVLDDFEGALADWSGQFKGRVVDAALVRGYVCSYFYSTVYMAGRHRVDSLNSIPAAKSWLQALSASKTDLGKAYVDWYAQVVAAEEGSANIGTLLAAVGRGGPLGARPRRQLFERAAGRYLAFGSHANRDAIQALLPYLDSRPEHALFLSDQLRALLFELNESQALFDHSAANRTADDASSLAWTASMRNDAVALRALAADPKVDLADRRYAVALLENPLKEGRDALDAVHRLVLRDGARDFHTVEWFAQDALDHGHPADARAALESWLALGLPDPGLERVIATALLSHAHYDEGHFDLAWSTAAPVIESGQGDAIRRAAWAAGRLDRAGDAQKLWDYVLKRYGQSSETKLDYLRFLWAHGRDSEAADVIASWAPAPDSRYWGFSLAPAFHDANRERPDSEIVAAFQALRNKGLAGHLIKYLPEAFHKDGRNELAFRMREGLRGVGLAQIEIFVEAYQDLKAWQGKEKALAWLRQSIPQPSLNPSSMVFYEMHEPDLLWDLIGDPAADNQGGHGEWVWLIRAASAVRDREPSPERLQRLRDYFVKGDDKVQLLGRYLLGLESESKVLAYPWPAPELYEGAYILGLKAQCDGHLAQASDWYQVVVDRSAENKGESHWAGDQLYDWYARGQLLDRVPNGCGSTTGSGQPPA